MTAKERGPRRAEDRHGLRIETKVPGLAHTTAEGSVTDRFRAAAETDSPKERRERTRIVREIGARADGLAILRARLAGKFTTTEMVRAYRQGGAALPELLTTRTATPPALLRDLALEFVAEYGDRPAGARYDAQLARLIAHLGVNATPAALTTEAVAAFLKGLDGADGTRVAGQPLKGGTRNRYRAAIGAFAVWLIARRHITEHPIAHKRVRKAPEGQHRLPTLSYGDQADYGDAIERVDGPIWRLYFELLIESGPDVGEAFALRASRVEPERVYLRRPKTRTRERAAPMSEEFGARLAAHIAAHGLRGSDRVFGMLPDDGKTYWHVHARARAAIHQPELTVKDLRHLAAINWRRAGICITFIRDWLGHSSLTQTQIYSAFAPDHELNRELIERAAAAKRAALAVRVAPPDVVGNRWGVNAHATVRDMMQPDAVVSR